MPTACALELIHTYSLIHDDLPAMDDDDYRRGRLTNHKVFGEAMAILAGDALLTLAFRLVAANAARRRPSARWSRASSPRSRTPPAPTGMVGGQVVDIESEGKAITAEMLDYIHLHKTAALIRASLRVGARAGRRRRPQALRRDQRRRARRSASPSRSWTISSTSRATWPSSASPPAATSASRRPPIPRSTACRLAARGPGELIDETKRRLEPLGPPADPIRALADFVLERKS